MNLLLRLFCLSCCLLLTFPLASFGQDDSAPPQETAATEQPNFAEAKQEWTDLLEQLRQKLLEYRDAPQDQRGAIRDEYAALVEQGEQVLPLVVAAAQRAFEENPDASGEPAQFLAEAIQDQVFNRNQYEIPADVGAKLIAAGIKNPAAIEAIGVAMYYRGDYPTAIETLTQAAQLYEQGGGRGKLRPTSEVLAGQAQQQLVLAAQHKAMLALEEKLAEMESPDEASVREMLDMLRIRVHKLDDFEDAARISQMLIDKGVDDKGLYDVAGVAFFMTNQFDLAEEYLNKADEAGRISELGRQSLDNLIP